LIRRRALVGVLVAGVLAGACGGGQPSSSPPPATPSTPTRGGRIVIGAEQWAQCLNPITTCAQVSYVFWAILNPVIPKAMTLDDKSNWIASPLLTEAPTLANGGIATNPFTITYHLDPRAVWADGTPITAADFDFTWKAIMHTTGAQVTVGYDQITGVTGPDPHTVVVRFKQIVVDWEDLFGGPFQGILEKAAFPQVDPDKPDLRTAMSSSLPFSGGPWILQSWDKQQAVLVRNPKYWGHQPYLDQVTFVPREDQATEINSLLSGEIAAIWPQPSNVSLLRQLQENPNAQARAGAGTYFEALWFNVEHPPLDDSHVREALMYAIDRQAVIDAIVKLNNPTAQVLDCGAIAYTNVGPWCQGPEGTPFAKYHYDPAHAMSILTSAGWDCSAVASGGYCRKNGRDLTVDYATVAGNARRETTQALEIPKAKAAGFRLVVRNYQAGDLFSNILPKGQFAMGDYAQGGSPDPDVKSILGCESIPTSQNGWSGQNVTRWCDRTADRAFADANQALEVDKRQALLQSAYAAEEADHVLLPLYQLPNLVAWRRDKIAGPIGDYVESILSAYANLDQWYCASPGACQ
jgi:peptide/nickel transport system substrate-binding protein